MIPDTSTIFTIYFLGFMASLPMLALSRWYIPTYLMSLSNLVGLFPAYITYTNGYYLDCSLLFAMTGMGIFHRLSSTNTSPSIIMKPSLRTFQQIDISTKVILMLRLGYILKFSGTGGPTSEIILASFGLLLMLYTEFILSWDIDCRYLRWSPDLFHIWTHILETLRVKFSPSIKYRRILLYTGCHSLWVIIWGATVGYIYRRI